MKIKKESIIAVLAAFCLAVALFMTMPTRSQSGVYDPWLDVNDDGWIDMADISIEIDNFMSGGTPINKTGLILDLQNRVNALEKREDYVKRIGFYTPNETINIDPQTWKDAAVFVWNPQNVTNNAVLQGFFFFRYLSLYGFDVVRILINGISVTSIGVSAVTEYTQTHVYSFATSSQKASQSSYTVRFQIYTGTTTPICVRNINILLEVLDGLPPS